MIDMSQRNFMIDIETTGLNPAFNSITSIAIVEFDAERFTNLAFRTRVLQDASRENDEETMQWREDNKVDEMEAAIPLESSPDHMLTVVHALLSSPDCVVWAKPTRFDISFLESYFADYRNRSYIPWHYRNVVDLASFIKGRGKNIKELEAEVKAEMAYNAHDALDDCLFQIAVLRKAMEN